MRSASLREIVRPPAQAARRHERDVAARADLLLEKIIGAPQYEMLWFCWVAARIYYDNHIRTHDEVHRPDGLRLSGGAHELFVFSAQHIRLVGGESIHTNRGVHVRGCYNWIVRFHFVAGLPLARWDSEYTATVLAEYRNPYRKAFCIIVRPPLIVYRVSLGFEERGALFLAVDIVGAPAFQFLPQPGLKCRIVNQT